uniref:Small ribosomal subunit protein uS15 n=1 Tax=Macaca nemestrina TaxID=9545 RepID=A0A2K6C2L5_MACNE
MGRMHAPGKGLSQSALPYRRSVPTWLKLTSDDVKEQIYKLAKKGLTPSQIGVILRDSHGVAQVRFVTGNKILRILKSKGLAPDLPEDLYHLIKKAVAVRKHLERNRKDKDRAGFTVWLDIRRPSESSLPIGNMNHLQPLSWSHKFVCVLKQ